MAGEYTGGAYAGMKPIQEDFGDIAIRGIEIDLRQKASELAVRKERAAEAKAAQQKVADNFKDFSELASKAMNVHARNFDKEVVGQMVGDVKQKIAEYARRLEDPTISQSDVIRIKTDMQRLSNNAENFVTGQKTMQDYIASLRNVDVPDGWDSVLSGTSQMNVNKAIMSAAEKGMSANGDGTYNVGDYLKYRLDESGNPVILSRNDKGEWVEGTTDETVNRWRNQMTPYVDLQKNMWDYAGKGIQQRASEFYRNVPGGLIEIVRTNNWKEIDRMIGDDFDARFPNAESFDRLPKEVRKAVMSGQDAGWNSREDVRNAYIRTGRNKVKDETNIQLRNNPDYMNAYQRWRVGNEKNSKAYDTFINGVQEWMSGNQSYSSLFGGGEHEVALKDGTKAQIYGGERRGDDFVFKARVRDDKNKWTEAPDMVKVYDLNENDDKKAIFSIARQIWSGIHKGDEANLQESVINEMVDYSEKPFISTEGQDREKFREKLNGAMNDFEQMAEAGKTPDRNFQEATRQIEDALKDYGYELKKKSGNTWNTIFSKNLRLILKDSRGNREDVVVEGDTKEEFLDKLRNAVSDIEDEALKGIRYRSEINPSFKRTTAPAINTGTVSGANKNIPSLDNF